ncbi:MAG: DUF4251 domain-containing protein [Tannerellaceae bacterium]
MRRIATFMFALVIGLGAITQVHAQSKEAEKAARKAAEEVKKQEKKAAQAVQSQISFETAVQAIKDQSFVLEATTVQPMNGRVFYVNSNTNFVSLNNGQAMVQIASNSPYPGPNGLGGITVQGGASNIETKTDKDGNVYMSMSVQGVFISATVMIMLTNDTNNASVTVDPNFSGRNLRMTGTIYPYSMSNIFQGTTY